MEGATTLSITTLGIMTLSIMTLRIAIKNTVLSIMTLYAANLSVIYAEYRYVT